MLVSEIITEAARVFRVDRNLIAGRDRRRLPTSIRQALYVALRRRGASLSRIGSWMDRDHSTVIYGIKTAEKREAEDLWYATRIEHLTNLGTDRPSVLDQ